MKNSKGSDKYYTQLQHIAETVKPILGSIKEVFPQYTFHNISHAKEIIDILDLIIPDKLKRAFNEVEIFILLAAAYLHDIGMALLKDNLADEQVKQLEDNTEKLQEYIRDNHHIRSKKNYLGNRKINPFFVF